ncbi:unnamed protein product [Clonostachys rosea]|uniref:Uncharacterized protein n=1 Tax=Bionectria ochroleuca TaxID=29856 RepID=A0ABY6UV84_BIOOC|nr:unnamed protein product [Clonostachys rosea]
MCTLQSPPSLLASTAAVNHKEPITVHMVVMLSRISSAGSSSYWSRPVITRHAYTSMQTCLTTPKRLATVSCMPMTLPTGPIAARDTTIPYTSTITTPHSSNTATSAPGQRVAAMLDLHPLRPRSHLRQNSLSQRQRQRHNQRDPRTQPLPAVSLLLLDGRGLVYLRGLRAGHALESQDELQLQHQDPMRFLSGRKNPMARAWVSAGLLEIWMSRFRQWTASESGSQTTVRMAQHVLSQLTAERTGSFVDGMRRKMKTVEAMEHSSAETMSMTGTAHTTTDIVSMR